MNKSDLVNAVAKEASLSKKDADAAITAVVDSITKALKSGDKVQLVGFGTFSTRDRAAKEGLNPRTKEKIMIPATKVPAFKAGKALKDAIK